MKINGLRVFCLDERSVFAGIGRELVQSHANGLNRGSRKTARWLAVEALQWGPQCCGL
jgi:hypothetical protein